MTLDSEGLLHIHLVERAPVSAELQSLLLSSMALLGWYECSSYTA